MRKQASVLLGTCINTLRPDSDVSPASPVGHILGFALKGLRSASPSSNITRSPSPGMALAMGGDGSGGGQSIPEDLLGTLQIFENLYSARAMWMSPTYNEVCEMILHLQGHRPERQSCRRACPPDVCAARICAVYGVISPTNDEVLLGYLDQGQ